MDDPKSPEGIPELQASEAQAIADEEAGRKRTGPPTPWGLGEIALGVFATFSLGVAFGLLYNLAADDTQRMTLPKLLAAMAPGWLGYGAFALLVARNHPGGARRQLGLKFDLKNDIPKGIAFGIAGQVLAALVYVPINLIWPGVTDSLSDPANNLTQDLSSWRWVIFGLFVGVIAPLVEEIFFRGFALRAIASRYGVTAGIVGSGVLFGIIHITPLQTIALSALGLLLGWRATRTGRIGETVIAHSVFNLITLAALITS